MVNVCHADYWVWYASMHSVLCGPFCSDHSDLFADIRSTPLCCTTIPTTCRYKNFLGLNNANDFMAAAAEMKKKGDFTSLAADAGSINAVRAAGMPADKVLGISSDISDAEQAARYAAGLCVCVNACKQVVIDAQQAAEVNNKSCP